MPKCISELWHVHKCKSVLLFRWIVPKFSWFRSDFVILCYMFPCGRYIVRREQCGLWVSRKSYVMMKLITASNMYLIKSQSLVPAESGAERNSFQKMGKMKS